LISKVFLPFRPTPSTRPSPRRSVSVYGEVYKTFKQQLVVDTAHVNLVYSSPYVQHFFSDQAIQAMRAHWQKTDQS
jgi:hypothetical protein